VVWEDETLSKYQNGILKMRGGTFWGKNSQK